MNSETIKKKYIFNTLNHNEKQRYNGYGYMPNLDRYIKGDKNMQIKMSR